MSDAAALRVRLDAAPMGRVQTTVVALTCILSAVDGYDVLSVSFAAPAIAADWHIGKAALGVVLSAGLAGMAAGAFALAPLADVVGRKTVVLGCLAAMIIGMAWCGMAGSIPALTAGRVITGLGIGGCIATINPIAAEFANSRRRALTVSLMATGYPVGGLVGGLLAALLLRRYGWHSVFIAGSMAAAILLPLTVWLMPESIAYLLTRKGPQRLARINAVLARCGHAEVGRLDPAEVPSRRGYDALLRHRRGATAWITVANLLYAGAVFYLLSWLPQLVADAGFSPSQASLVSGVASGSGVVGGVALGWAAQRLGLRGLTSAAMIGMGLATIAFGAMPPSLPLLVAAGAVAGLFLFSGAAGMYATIATTFEDEARATASGFVSGVGRVSSAATPLIAGLLFAHGVPREQVSSLFGGIAIASGIIVLTGWRRYRPA